MATAAAAGAAWDAWWAEHAGTAAVAHRQQVRLAALVQHARRASPYYRRLYRALPPDVTDPVLLPPVAKPQLMEHFDEWVTDPRLTLAALRRDVLPDPVRVGVLHLGRYHVLTSSGSSGEPAVLVHDHRSWSSAGAVLGVRARRTLLRRDVLAPVARHGLRVAALLATGGHFAAVTAAEDLRRRGPRRSERLRVLSVLRPLPELAAELDAFRPTVLVGYPSAVGLLAEEQAGGRLRIAPALVAVGGETLTPAARRRIRAAFGCPVLDEYAASEAPGLAVQCHRGALHVNADRYLFEPVDEAGRPVPPGTTSATVLVTDLGNRVQPLIRYDLGDRVELRACPCGSPLPAVRVEGRAGDVLRFASADGRTVPVLPLALGTVVEQTPGVRRFQAVRTAPDTLVLRLEPEPGAEPARVRAAVEARMRAFLTDRGLGAVGVRHAPGPPRPDPSGKFRQVWSA
ncbi:CoF synthetase [Kocuria sp. CNJ-770]|uniref:phenylacetate--CoA ligase family protein n=1 Tax=Kocuria sp. CNJ-770 TaxID=1904964 RepID=UPI000965B44E|nr:AMP-binding protein [Kocuria sp. CNJ-770]OLT09551.1 CoF synthetase [Kocuria sp. CNJ-770]